MIVGLTFLLLFVAGMTEWSLWLCSVQENEEDYDGWWNEKNED